MKRVVKALLDPSTGTYKFLSYLWNLPRDYWKPRFVGSLDDILGPYALLQSHHTFVQVGSFDGISGDPLHGYVQAHGWLGVLVEPVPRSFRKLKETYRERSDLIFMNCAVSDEPGKRPLFQFDEKYRDLLPAWSFQLASFDREMLFRHAIPDAGKYITSEIVEVRTMTGILDEHGIRRVDLIHTDTEGHDYIILRSTDLKQLDPGIIIFEFRHLRRADFRASLGMLHGLGYQTYRCVNDIIAVKRQLHAKLRRKFKSRLYAC
jgi:FkbM family methyltransferase